MNTRGNEIIARALGGGLDHHGGFDLNEAVLGKVVARNLGNFASEHDVVEQRTAAQVEIAEFQAQLLVGVEVVHDFKGRRLRLGKHAQVGDDHLDIARGYLAVLGASLADHALSSENELAAAGKRLVENLLVGLIVERELHDARAVAQVNKNQLAEVSAALYPAADDDLTANVGDSQISAVMGTLQARHIFHIFYLRVF